MYGLYLIPEADEIKQAASVGHVGTAPRMKSIQYWFFLILCPIFGCLFRKFLYHNDLFIFLPMMKMILSVMNIDPSDNNKTIQGLKRKIPVSKNKELGIINTNLNEKIAKNNKSA
ncbi:hypothetical protein BED47_02685 [Gottfriedia luciferensis]|uniref:Uncharacterized protein n=1 Tax=Gottfriedia luciferensis TaxID=178774 RepID=A0ABX2ZU08_9BACI|nr:hypothetical protein BED47_02685 [Gottfriedia luciferensis]